MRKRAQNLVYCAKHAEMNKAQKDYSMVGGFVRASKQAMFT